MSDVEDTSFEFDLISSEAWLSTEFTLSSFKFASIVVSADADRERSFESISLIISSALANEIENIIINSIKLKPKYRLIRIIVHLKNKFQFVLFVAMIKFANKLV